jgi:prophage regulatory protein
MTDRVLRVAETQAVTGLGRTTLWRLERAGEFPKRRQVTRATVGYLESEVAEWLRSRPTVLPDTPADEGRAA